jgi:hypothetical protein
LISKASLCSVECKPGDVNRLSANGEAAVSLGSFDGPLLGAASGRLRIRAAPPLARCVSLAILNDSVALSRKREAPAGA